FKRAVYAVPRQSIDIGRGHELWFGLFQSALLGSRPYLNVDVSHKAFPMGAPVLKVIGDFNRGQVDQVSGWVQQELHSFLKGMDVVYTNPTTRMAKRMRCNGLREPASQQMFKLEDGTRLSVADYFARKLNFRLRYPNLPVLHVGSTVRSVYVPAELCDIPAGQALNKNNPEECTRDIIRYAATSAGDGEEVWRDAAVAGNALQRADGTVRYGENVRAGARYAQLSARHRHAAAEHQAGGTGGHNRGAAEPGRCVREGEAEGGAGERTDRAADAVREGHDGGQEGHRHEHAQQHHAQDQRQNERHEPLHLAGRQGDVHRGGRYAPAQRERAERGGRGGTVRSDRLPVQLQRAAAGRPGRDDPRPGEHRAAAAAAVQAVQRCAARAHHVLPGRCVGRPVCGNTYDRAAGTARGDCARRAGLQAGGDVHRGAEAPPHALLPAARRNHDPGSVRVLPGEPCGRAGRRQADQVRRAVRRLELPSGQSAGADVQSVPPVCALQPGGIVPGPDLLRPSGRLPRPGVH
uniref:PAZ domain-containing protein n=1 Tax=Anopheles coluzzii TaxID=1518534 RepID=A0A6E8WBL6_ANOCL